MFDINEVWVPLCNPNQGKCLCFPARLVCQCSLRCCKYTARHQLKINGSRETLGYAFHTILTLYTASHLHTRQSSSAVSRECRIIHQIKLYNFMRILTLFWSQSNIAHASTVVLFWILHHGNYCCSSVSLISCLCEVSWPPDDYRSLGMWAAQYCWSKNDSTLF